MSDHRRMVDIDTPRWRAASDVVRPRRCIFADMRKVYGGLGPLGEGWCAFAQVSHRDTRPAWNDARMPPRLQDVEIDQRLSRDEEATLLDRHGTRMMQLRLVMAGLLDDAPRRPGPRPPPCGGVEGWGARGQGGAVKRLVAEAHPRPRPVASVPPPPLHQER